ncbi:MAG: YdcF family protein [Hyphomicrobiaceae bacterium]
MPFVLSKAIWLVAQPSSVMILMVIAGALMAGSARARWATRGRRLALAGGLLLTAAGLLPVGHWLTIPLEDRFSRPDIARLGRIHGIIVLGGAIETTVSKARGVVTLNEAGERMSEAAMLARRLAGTRLVFSGGSGAILFEGMTESELARRWFVEEGIAAERIVLEDLSRTTRENAEQTAALLARSTEGAGGRYLLVTSAYHMPRAIGTFRHAGLDVVAFPVDYRSRGIADLWRPFDKPSEGLRRVDIVVREWMGLLAYRLTGATDRLWPGP